MSRSISTARLGAVILGLSVALAGCGSGKATPIVVYVTPAPTVTPTAAPTATAKPTASPVPSATPIASTAPTDSAPTDSAAPTSGASVPAGGVADCTGTADHKAFFVDAASNLSFDVYCAVLPSSWWLQTVEYTLPDGGHFSASYKNAAGAIISTGQGNICKPPKVCASLGGNIGATSFGGLPATLYTTESGGYALMVGPISNPSYIMSGQSVTKAQFVSYAAGMVKVAKP